MTTTRWSLSVALIYLLTVTAGHGENRITCDPGCVDGIGHSYESGKSYVYKYETLQNIDAFLGNGDNSVADQTVKVECKISLTSGDGTNRCQLSLDISSWTATFPQITSTEDGESSPRVVSVEFGDAAKFSYSNGTVHGVCLPDDDVWKNNIRRAMISLFQTDIEFLNLPKDESRVNKKDVGEIDLSGKRFVRYYKFDPLHLSKVAVTSSSLQTFWTASGTHPLSEDRNIFRVFDKLEEFHELEFESKPLKSYSNLVQRYNNLLIDTKTPLVMLDSVEMCSQDFDGNVLKKVDCTESRIRTSVFIKSELHTRSNLSLDSIIDVSQQFNDVYSKLIPSTVEFDTYPDKPSSDPQVLQNFKRMVRSDLCQQVLETTDSIELLEYVDVMKKLTKRVSRKDLEHNFEFVKDSLDCGTPNRQRQVQIFLNIAAMSLTEDVVEFFVEQTIQGNVKKGELIFFLTNLATMEFPGPRSLHAMGNLLLNKNRIPYEFEILDVLLPSSSMVRAYQSPLLVIYKRLSSVSNYEPFPVALHPQLAALLRAINSTVGDLDRLEKMEVLRGLWDFTPEQNIETCENLARDDFERVNCLIPCDAGELTSSDFARNLFRNDTADPGAQIAAWLYLAKCVSKDNLQFLYDQLDISNEEVKAFIKSHIAAANDMSSDLENFVDSSPLTQLQRSRTFIKLDEYGNSNHVDKYEGNIVFGTTGIPRLVTAEYDLLINSRVSQTFRFLELEITANNFEEGVVHAFIAIRRYGTTLYCRSISIRPTVYLKWLQDNNLIMDDVLRVFASRIPEVLNLFRNRDGEYLRFNPILRKHFSVPTISGLPFQQNLEFEAILSLNLTLQKIGQLGKSEFHPTLHVAPKFGKKIVEKSVLGVGNSEVIGYQYAGWKQIDMGATLGVSKTREGPLQFQVSFPKESRPNETLNAFKIEEESKFQKFQFLEDFTKYQLASPYNYDADTLQRKLQSMLFGTQKCQEVISNSDKYLLNSYRCTVSDWFFTISTSPTGKSLELKIFPSNPVKSNSFAIIFKSIAGHQPNRGHEIDLRLESPYKDINLNLNVSIVQDDKRSLTSLELSAICDQSTYSVGLHVNRKHSIADNYQMCLETAGLSCRNRSCDFCKSEYDFSFKATTPIKGWEEIVPIQGYLDFGFKKTIILYIESNGILKPLDSMLKVQFQGTMLKLDGGADEGNQIPEPLFNYPYNVSLEVRNDYLGRISTTTQLYFNNDYTAEETIQSSIYVEYGKAQPFQTILCQSTLTVRAETFLLTSRASQFPVYDFDYKTDRRDTRSRDDKGAVIMTDTFEEQVLISHKFTRVSNPRYSIPEFSIGMTLNRNWKNLRLRSLIERLVFDIQSDELAHLSNFDVKNLVKIYIDGEIMMASRVDARRENRCLKAIDFTFQMGSDEETLIKWDSSDTELSLKTQVKLIGSSYKTEHLAISGETNQWNYRGRFSKTPGASYIASGTLELSQESLIGFKALNLSTSGAEPHPSDMNFVYNKDDSIDSTVYKLVISDYFLTIFEYNVEIEKNKPRLPVRVNMFFQNLFKTEALMLRGPGPTEVNFVLTFPPLGLKYNGTLTLPQDLSEEKQFLKAVVDWGNELDPKEFGRIESDSIFDPAADFVIQSRTTFSIRDSIYKVTILSSMDIDYIPSPLIYIYFTDPDRQMYGVNFTTVVELDNSDEDDRPDLELGFSLKYERPEIQPFLIDYSVRSFKEKTVFGSPGQAKQSEDVMPLSYKWFGRSNYTTSLRFIHRDNVLLFADDTDVIMTGDVDLYNDNTASRVTVNTHFKAENLYTPEIKMHSQLELNTTDDGFDIQYEGFVQNDRSMYKVCGSLDRFEGDVIHEPPDGQIQSEQSLLVSMLSTVHSNGSVLRPRVQLSYQVSSIDVTSNETAVYLVGSHIFSRYFESWNRFEAKIVSDVQCGTSKRLTWTDVAKKTTRNFEERRLQISSSNLFEILTYRDGKVATANITILHPSHKLDSSVAFEFRRSPTGDEEIWNLDTKFVYQSFTSGGLKISNAYNRNEESIQIYKSIADARLNDVFYRIEHDAHLGESQHASELKHSLAITSRYGTDGDPYVYSYWTSTVVGEVKEIAEILHHDFTIEYGPHRNMKDGILKGSFTITSPAYLPLVFELKKSSNSNFGAARVNTEKVFLLLGKIPEFDCGSNNGEIFNLNTHPEFPIDLKSLRELAQAKLYCNQYYESIRPEEYSEFRKKDGRFSILTFSNGTVLDEFGQTVRKLDFQTTWKDNQCISEFSAADNIRNYNKQCGLILKPLPTCWVQPSVATCGQNKLLWMNPAARNAVCVKTSFFSLLGLFGLPYFEWDL